MCTVSSPAFSHSSTVTHAVLKAPKQPLDRDTGVEQQQNAEKELRAVGERKVVQDEPPQLVVTREMRGEGYVEKVLAGAGGGEEGGGAQADDES